MPRCSAVKPDGEQCGRIVGASQRYCYSHDPARERERSRNASKAGRAKPSKDVISIKGQLQELTDQVIAGQIDKAAASIAGQLLNIKLRAIELERKIREQDELLTRIEALEDLRQGSLESRRMHTR